MASAEIAIKLNDETIDVDEHIHKGNEEAVALKDVTDTPNDTVDAQFSDLIPQPPDGGWGWVIVFASFMNHFIIDGICYAFGILLPSYMEYFHSSTATTSALMSTLIGCYLLSAPVASALVNKFGCRVVGIAGSLIAAAAFVLSTFVKTIDMLILVLGGFGGIGFGLMYLPAVVSVSLYFEKKRAIAIGIAMCGTGVGTFTFGPFGKWLAEEMDWKNMHFVLASFILQGIVFSFLVRPLVTEKDKTKGNKEEKTPQPNPVVSSQRSRIPDQSSFGSVRLHRSAPYLGTHSADKSKPVVISKDKVDDLKRPMYKKDIFYSGSIYNLKEYQDAGNLQDYVASIVTLPAMHEEPVKRCNLCSCKFLPSQMADILSEMLDFGLFSNLSFNIIFFAVLLMMLAYFIPFAYVTVRAQLLGISADNASFLLSIMGLSTMCGRIGACLLAQIPNLRSITVHNIFLFGAGLSALFVPLCLDYATMATTAFFYGLFMGGHVSLSPIVLVDSLGLQRLTSSYGLMTLARGISTLAGPPLAGYLYDLLNSHDSSFYMCGTLIIVSTVGFCALELPYFRNKKQTTPNSA